MEELDYEFIRDSLKYYLDESEFWYNVKPVEHQIELLNKIIAYKREHYLTKQGFEELFPTNKTSDTKVVK